MDSKKRHLILVEIEKFRCEGLRILLTENGHSPFVASNHQDAIQLLSRATHVAVLYDYGDDQSCATLITALRRARPNVRFILFSDREIDNPEQYAPASVIKRPFELGELLRTLAELP